MTIPTLFKARLRIRLENNLQLMENCWTDYIESLLEQSRHSTRTIESEFSITLNFFEPHDGHTGQPLAGLKNLLPALRRAVNPRKDVDALYTIDLVNDFGSSSRDKLFPGFSLNHERTNTRSIIGRLFCESGFSHLDLVVLSFN